MSLRFRIMLLVLLTAFVPSALFVLHVLDNRKSDIAEAKQSLNVLAAFLAEDLTGKISGTVQLLHGLSRAADLDIVDKGACSAFLGDVLKHYPQYTGLLTVRPNGTLNCDSLRSGRTLDLNDRAYFKQARTSAGPAFEAVFGRLTGVAVLQVAFPARDSRGELKYVLLASLNLAKVSERYVTVRPHPDMEVVIWDGKGTVMARHPDDGPKKLAGSSQANSALYRFARSEHTGDTAELPGPDGTRKIWAHSTLPVAAGSELLITLGIPRDTLIAKADQALRRALTILAGGSLLALLGALLFAELGIRRPVARVITVAERQREGDLGARIDAPYPRGELGNLMATLDATAASVQSQQLDIERKAEELRRTNRTLRVLSAINSLIVRVRDRDELFREACRIAVEEGTFSLAWIGLVDAEKQEVIPMTASGEAQPIVGKIRLSTRADLPEGQGPVGLVVRSGKPFISNDLEQGDGLVRAENAAQGPRSMVVLPLRVREKTAGVMELGASVPDFFDEEEMRLLTELAGDISFAIDHLDKQERLDYLAYYDVLTGLANRVLFLERLEQKVIAAGRVEHKLAVSIVDIERFKTINDAFGRQAGDELLRQVAGRMKSSGPDPTRVARIGADHFAIVSADLETEEDVGRLTEQRLDACFAPPFRLEGQDLRISARVGIAMYPADGKDPEALFANAEAALDKAKATGERYLFFAPAMTDRIRETLSLENKLRQAREKDQFVLHYQPKVDLETRQILGMEALIRWQSPELGLVPPMKFIPLLEATGLILQVGSWALRRAAMDHRTWVEAGLKPPKVAVNVSPIQLRQRDFVEIVEQAIMEGVAPTGIDLEITESLIMDDVEGNIEKLKSVRRLGINIAVDDFGTGYSSLGYLAKLPVQTLKIDRSFIITMLNDSDTMTLVSTIISLAHSLRLKVVAEGVEEEEQAKVLRLLRCDEMQGYLVSKPIPFLEMTALLKQQSQA